MLGNRTDPPGLTHTSDHTSNAKAERNTGSNSMGQLIGLVVVLCMVATEATLEDKMVRYGDAGVNSQPVGDKVHKVLQNGLEV